MILNSLLLVTFMLILCSIYRISKGQVELCQLNCEDSSSRLAGPTKMPDTRPHPWKQAKFPSASKEFCKFGCRIFYSEVPKNTTCKNLCGYNYRYKITAQYSDIAEMAKLECQDGCDIALQICQAGYYCNEGIMLPCPPGTFREAILKINSTELSKVQECVPCPYGRYRTTTKGVNADDCTKCPIGTYNDKLGSVSPDACLRCPAGMNAEEPGMRFCKCITNSSCGVTIDGKRFYDNGIDYYRETVPFIGRW